MGDYAGLWRFLSANPQIVSPSEINNLTNQAMAEEKAGRAQRAQKCIHHAILLRRCLEGEREKLFFERMSDNESDTFRDVFRVIQTAYANIQVAARGSPPTQDPRITFVSQNSPDTRHKGESDVGSLANDLTSLSITQKQGKVISVS
jgi:hypothetical protein